MKKGFISHLVSLIVILLKKMSISHISSFWIPFENMWFVMILMAKKQLVSRMTSLGSILLSVSLSTSQSRAEQQVKSLVSNMQSPFLYSLDTLQTFYANHKKPFGREKNDNLSFYFTFFNWNVGFFHL